MTFSKYRFNICLTIYSNKIFPNFQLEFQNFAQLTKFDGTDANINKLAFTMKKKMRENLFPSFKIINK